MGSSESHFPDPAVEAPLEAGYPAEEPQSAGPLPPGGGKLAVPHYTTFTQLVNLASRTYRAFFDEALRHSDKNALACRRDPVIMEALRRVQIPVAQLEWHLECEDQQDTRQTAAVDDLTDIINHIPRFQQLKMHLLEALWYGRYGVQLVYQWDWLKGQKRLRVADHRPINGDKLCFRYSGRAGILVHATYPGSWEITERGRAHFFTQEEREQVLIHRHEPEDSDFFEPEKGGAVMGLGIRDRVYWYWYLKYQITAFLMDYLERVGAGGFTIYYYEAGNPTSLEEVKNAAEEQWRNNAVLFPRYKDGSTGGPGIERVEPSNAGAQLLQALVQNYFDEVIRRYIIGDTQSEDASGGVGSGVADLLSGNMGRIIKYHAVNLADTLTSDLVRVLQKYLYPGIPPLKFCFDIDKPNSAEYLDAAQRYWDMGGSVDSDALREAVGLPKPEPGKEMLAKMGSMSPAAAGSLPTGTPILGQPGPEAGGLPGQVPPDAQQPVSDQPQEGQAPVQMRHWGARVRMAALDSQGGPKHNTGMERKVLQAHPGILKHANDYLASAGLPPHEAEAAYLPVDVARSKEVADLYSRLKHAPNDPAVRAAYLAMRAETYRQYRHLLEQGVGLEPWVREGQPYRDSAEMAADARRGHLYFYLGGGPWPAGHLLGEDSGVKFKGGRPLTGRPLTYNDLFRAVHDYYGHALYGNQFGPRGEEHAYRTHARMFSPAARPAMAAETRGQNSWVNFGPHSHLPVTERPYAEQKNVVLPPHLLGD